MGFLSNKKYFSGEEPTEPAAFHEGQFLMFVGDSASLGDPNNHTDIAAYYTKVQ